MSETSSVKEQLSRTGLPAGNRLLLADSGFDDKALFEICRQFKSLLVTTLTAAENSSAELFLREALYVDYLNCGLYGRYSTSIDPLFGYCSRAIRIAGTDDGLYPGYNPAITIRIKVVAPMPTALFC